MWWRIPPLLLLAAACQRIIHGVIGNSQLLAFSSSVRTHCEQGFGISVGYNTFQAARGHDVGRALKIPLVDVVGENALKETPATVHTTNRAQKRGRGTMLSLV